MAWDFTAVQDRWRAAHAAKWAFGAGDTYTFMFWFLPTDTSTGRRLAEHWAGGANPGWAITLTGSNAIQTYVVDVANGAYFYNSTNTVTDNALSQAVVRINQDSMDLDVFVNGQAANHYNIPGAAREADSDQTLALGGLQGHMIQTAAWDVGLSDAQCRGMWNGGLPMVNQPQAINSADLLWCHNCMGQPGGTTGVLGYTEYDISPAKTLFTVAGTPDFSNAPMGVLADWGDFDLILGTTTTAHEGCIDHMHVSDIFAHNMHITDLFAHLWAIHLHCEA